MPAIQTSYGLTHAVAYEGAQANMEPVDIMSRTVENAALAFGRAVQQGSTDNAVRVGGSGVFRGLSVASYLAYPSSVPATVAPDLYPIGATAAIATKGVFWVTAGATVGTVGVPAYFDASGNITPTSAGNTAIANAIFDSSGASGSLVKLRLN